MNNDTATDKRIQDYLERFAKMPLEKQALHMAISLRFLRLVLEQEHAKDLQNGWFALPGPVEGSD